MGKLTEKWLLNRVYDAIDGLDKDDLIDLVNYLFPVDKLKVEDIEWSE
jgi:1,4-dihydroxy-2-naphthoyl-CoA synthase